MKSTVKRFNELTLDELYDILQLRSDVFVLEQTCLYQDIDGVDKDSTHVFLVEEQIVAYARIFEKNTCTLQMGRVLSRYRGKGYGKQVVKDALEICDSLGYEKIYIEAQEYAIKFYENFGFKVVSTVFLEDGIPHVKMEKSLKKNIKK